MASVNLMESVFVIPTFSWVQLEVARWSVPKTQAPISTAPTTASASPPQSVIVMISGMELGVNSPAHDHKTRSARITARARALHRALRSSSKTACVSQGTTAMTALYRAQAQMLAFATRRVGVTTVARDLAPATAMQLEASGVWIAARNALVGR